MDEFKGLFGEFQPVLRTVFRVSQFFLELGKLALKVLFLAKVLLVIKEIAVAHLGEAVDFVLGRKDSFGLHLVNLATLLNFAVVGLVEHFNRPVLELRKDSVTSHFRLHRLYEFAFFNGSLLTVRSLLVVGAMVKSVFLDFALALDGFMLGLRGDSPFAFPAGEDLFETEIILLRSRVAFLTEQSLYSVVLLKGDHRLVCALSPLTILLFD